jgi:hypothetical protein
MRANATTPITDWMRGNALGLVAIFLALTGTAYATHPGGANTISSGDIIDNEVKAPDIGTGEVKSGDIGDFEVKADDIAPNSLGGNKIADRSVKNADLGLGASSSNTIADGGIQGVDVKNNTLTGPQIDEGTLFNDNSLTGADIDESTLSGLPSANAWTLNGNSGTTAANFLGTTDNNPLNLRVNDARALRLEPASDGSNQTNVIGGSPDNAVTSNAHAATIAGGGRAAIADPTSANRVTDDNGTVGGGGGNQAGDDAGPPSDRAFATVAGGFENTASGANATVGGGRSNAASGVDATVPGGDNNSAQGDVSLAAGRRAKANHRGAFVWADSNPFDFPSTAQDQFSVRSTGGAHLVSGIDEAGNPTAGLELPAGESGWSTLAGEPFDVTVNDSRGLRIEPASDGTNQSPNVIGGIVDNSVTSGAHSATIAGGGRSDPSDPASSNRVTDDSGTVGGGGGNQAGDGAGTVSDGSFATVGGGFVNTASGIETTVGGGRRNTAGGDRATVGGGQSNTAGGFLATVGGGTSNTASGTGAAVGGGDTNAASGNAATVPGGLFNTASGFAATVPGGDNNRAQGDYGFAAGFGAQANNAGTFVWGDSQQALIDSTANDQFIARAQGHFFLQSDSSLDDQGGFLNTSTGAFLDNGGTWTNASDENLKAGFERVDPKEVLERVESMPVRSWHYKAEPSVRHIGPVAQDFYRAFGVGPDDRHIASVDADGVALAAIKGLNEKVERLHRKLASLRERDRSR